MNFLGKFAIRFGKFRLEELFRSFFLVIFFDVNCVLNLSDSICSRFSDLLEISERTFGLSVINISIRYLNYYCYDFSLKIRITAFGESFSTIAFSILDFSGFSIYLFFFGSLEDFKAALTTGLSLNLINLFLINAWRKRNTIKFSFKEIISWTLRGFDCNFCFFYKGLGGVCFFCSSVAFMRTVRRECLDSILG